MLLSNNLLSTQLSHFNAFTPLPDVLFSKTFYRWNHDLVGEIDWDDFIEGQKTMHISYNSKEFKGRIMLNSLQFGGNPQTFEGMWRNNQTMSVLVKENPNLDINGEIITIGTDIDKMFFANAFKQQQNISGIEYWGVLILQDINAFLNNINNSEDIGFTNNIKLNNPLKKGEKYVLPNGEEKTHINFTYMEVNFPKPIAFLGLDTIFDDNEKELLIKKTGSKNVFTFNKTRDFTIAPTQFAVWALDNYGIANKNDITNAVKVLTFTSDIGGGMQASAKKMQKGGMSDVVSGLGSIFSFGSSLASKLYGDSRALSAETAISTIVADSESSFIKLFIQPLSKTNELLKFQLKRSNAEFNILVNKSPEANITQLISKGTLLPNQSLVVPNSTEDKKYSSIGIQSIINFTEKEDYKNTADRIPFLKAPFAKGDFVMKDVDISNYLSFGVPRENINVIKNRIAPAFTPDSWLAAWRWNGFRPSPYTFMNYPILYNSLVANVFDVVKVGTPVSYNKSPDDREPNIAAPLNSHKFPFIQEKFWSTGLTIGDIAKNNFKQPNKTFTSLSFETTDEAKPIFNRLDICGFTSSDVILRLWDKKPTTEEDKKNYIEYRFKSQGQRIANAAKWLTTLYL